jgi:hypothetical protein
MAITMKPEHAIGDSELSLPLHLQGPADFIEMRVFDLIVNAGRVHGGNETGAG